MFGEGNDVLGALPEWRNAELNLTETVKEILAEPAFFDRGFEILVGGSDNADIDLDLAVAAEAVERLAVEHAQQFHLRLQLQFADFVEEKRAPVGHFEQALFGGVGAAEGTFLVSEEFALDEILRKRSAVDVDPRSDASVRRLVNGARDQFLTRASLSSDEHGFRVARDAVDQSHEAVHHGAGQDEYRVINLAGNHARWGRGQHRRGRVCNAGTGCGQGHDHRDQRCRGGAQNRRRELHGKTRSSFGLSEKAALIVNGRRNGRHNRFSQERTVFAVCLIGLRKERTKVPPHKFLG